MLFSLFTAALALDVSQYPARDQVPPTNSEWTALVTRDKTIPNTPPSSSTTRDGNLEYFRCRNDSDWAITFDDGPTSSATGRLLDALARQNIKATFFVIGSRILEAPEVLQRAYREGHEIGIHTWSHPYMTTLTNDQIVAEIAWTARIIRDVIGVTPRFFRNPYGNSNDRVRALLKAMDLELVLWNRDTGDTSGANVVTSFTEFAKTKNGPISLAHDLFDSEVDNSIPALDIPSKNGFKTVLISQCIQAAAYGNSVFGGNTPGSGTTSSSSSSSTGSTSSSSSGVPIPTSLGGFNFPPALNSAINSTLPVIQPNLPRYEKAVPIISVPTEQPPLSSATPNNTNSGTTQGTLPQTNSAVIYSFNLVALLALYVFV